MSITARKSKRPTNRDVARLAGVSTAVVSYVLNGGPRPTSSEVRERVLKAAKALDYHPSAIARGLRSQKSHTVGFIVCDYSPLDVFVSPYSAGILTGLMDQLKSNGHYLTVYPVALDEELSAFRRFLRDGRLDGVVIRLAQEPPANDSILELIASSNIPCVCIERSAPKFVFPCVTIDEADGGYAATRYLIEQSHRRIAHIHGDLRYLSAQVRMERYRQALIDAGLQVDEQLIRGGTWDPADGAIAMEQLLSLSNPPTAVFAADDSLAFRALQMALARHLRVPEDIALIGFDDIPLASESIPPLTTMRIPLVEMGRQAADLILRAMRAHTEPAESFEVESVVVTTELVRRCTA